MQNTPCFFFSENIAILRESVTSVTGSVLHSRSFLLDPINYTIFQVSTQKIIATATSNTSIYEYLYRPLLLKVKYQTFVYHSNENAKSPSKVHLNFALNIEREHLLRFIPSNIKLKYVHDRLKCWSNLLHTLLCI